MVSGRRLTSQQIHSSTVCRIFPHITGLFHRFPHAYFSPETLVSNAPFSIPRRILPSSHLAVYQKGGKTSMLTFFFHFTTPIIRFWISQNWNSYFLSFFKIEIHFFIIFQNWHSFYLFSKLKLIFSSFFKIKNQFFVIFQNWNSFFHWFFFDRRFFFNFFLRNMKNCGHRLEKSLFSYERVKKEWRVMVIE